MAKRVDKGCCQSLAIFAGIVGAVAEIKPLRLVVISPIDYWKIASDEFLLWD